MSPDGQTQVVGPAFAGNAFVDKSTGAFGNFTSQQISFTIPSGMSNSDFLDPAATTLSFSLTYNISTAAATSGTATTPLSVNLIGSAASFFDTLTLYSNSVPIETINQYGLLQNFLLQNTVNQAERNGLSISMGCDSNSANGIDLNFTSVSTQKYNFCIPLLSIIGANTVDKFFPVGAVNNLQLFLTTANLYPLVSYVLLASSQTITQPAFGQQFTLSEFSLNMKYIDIGDAAANMLSATLNNGKYYMKSLTYIQSSVSLPSNSAGTQQLLLQIRATSLKSVIHQFGLPAGASTPNQYYDAVNPGLTSRQLQIGGSNLYPSKPINDSQRPAEAYPILIQSLGGSLIKSYGTTVTREMYNSTHPTIPTGSDSTLCTLADGLRVVGGGSDIVNKQLSKWPSSAYYGYDVEKCAGVLFTGVNSRSSPPFLNLFLGASTGSNTFLMNAWGIVDAIVEIDVMSKSVVAYI